MSQSQNKLGWGGARENAGRKSTWNNKETCTIRIPRVFASKLYETAQKWDKEVGFQSDNDNNSRLPNLEFVSESRLVKLDTVTKLSQNSLPQLSEAVELAKYILAQKKSARISVAKFLTKLYSKTVKIEDLK